MKFKISVKKAVIISVCIAAVVIACLVISNQNQRSEEEKVINAQIDSTVTLYHQVIKADSLINNTQKEYIANMTKAIDNGTFSEDDESIAFDNMIAKIDNEILSLNLSALCESLSDKPYGSGFSAENKSKLDSINAILDNLISIGQSLHRFSYRDSKWENEPWCSLNSSGYHNFSSVKEEREKISKLVPVLNAFAEVNAPKFDNDDSDALVEEAIQLYFNKGGVEGKKRGLELFKKAAEMGNAAAMYDVAVITEDSDAANAKILYRKSAIAGDARAMAALAEQYYDWRNPNDVNKGRDIRKLAHKWYERAANYGSGEGLFRMALNYYTGWYDQKDEVKAAKFAQAGMVCSNADCANLYGALQKTPAEQAKFYRVALQFDPNYVPAKDNLRKLGYDY